MREGAEDCLWEEGVTDLEMTKLCAEAMGLTIVGEIEGLVRARYGAEFAITYRPLHDDAQAMALMKRFGIRSIRTSGDLVEWSVTIGGAGPFGSHAMNADLNCAIVECVAKMQVAS